MGLRWPPTLRWHLKGRGSRIEPAYLAADTCRHGKEAEPPPQPKTWTIYKIAAKVIWFGTVEVL
jgi:hypothetical protein